MPGRSMQIMIHKTAFTTRSNKLQQGLGPTAQIAPPPPPQVKNLFGLVELFVSFALTTTWQQLQAFQNITFAPIQVGPAPIVAVAPAVAVANPPVVGVRRANRRPVPAQNAVQNVAIAHAPQVSNYRILRAIYVSHLYSNQGHNDHSTCGRRRSPATSTGPSGMQLWPSQQVVGIHGHL